MGKPDRFLARSLSAVSEAPPSEELGVETLWRGASDTALRLLARDNFWVARHPLSMHRAEELRGDRNAAEFPRSRLSCPKVHNHQTAGHEWQVIIEADESVVLVGGTQVVPIDGPAYALSQFLAGILVGSKMNPAVNASVRDVVSNLVKRAVLQDDVGHRRIRQRDRMSILAVNPSKDSGCRVASAAVV